MCFEATTLQQPAQGQGMVFKKFYEDFCLDQPCGVMITKYFTENFFPFNK